MPSRGKVERFSSRRASGLGVSSAQGVSVGCRSFTINVILRKARNATEMHSYIWDNRGSRL